MADTRVITEAAQQAFTDDGGRRAIDTPLPRNPAGKILKNLLRGMESVSFDPGDLA